MLLFFGFPDKQPEKVGEDVQAYFKHLIATFDALTPDDGKRHLATKIQSRIEAVADKPEILDWDYLFELEYLILRLMPAEVLARKKWVIRDRFEEAVGKQNYKEYLDTKPPDSPDEALVADLGIVLDDLFWRHKLHTLWEKQWKRLVTGIAWGFAGVAAVILVFAITWGLYADSVDARMVKAIVAVLALALVGMAGSLISLIQRFQSVPSENKRTVNLIGLENGSALVLQSLMTGAVFALLMPLLFGSGMLKGDLFPEINWGETFLDGLAALPNDGPEFAMLLLWGFVAGFAERLVPDILNRLTTKTVAAEKKPKDEPLGDESGAGGAGAGPERRLQVTASASVSQGGKSEAEKAGQARPEPVTAEA